MASRLPRFKRASTVAPMRLTERDRRIIRLVHRHRFLRSPQIVILIGGSPQQLLRRLKLLYHHGFLERPRAQIDRYRKDGSQHFIYGLGNKSLAFLKQELNVDFREVSWGEKNRGVGRIFLEHALLVSDVMVSLELACRKYNGIKLLYEDQLALRSERQPFQWHVKTRDGIRLGVIPDRVFALEYAEQNGQPERVHFFLEADRGTMPVVRSGLTQTSFYRKLIAYEATWTQKIHQRRLGIHRFRVLTVTTIAARVKSLLDACSQLKRGHGLFLFADRTVLEKDPFSAVWRRGKSSETAGILDLPEMASHTVS
jgi:DNA-binding Lrp family transcriptional regulator